MNETVMTTFDSSHYPTDVPYFSVCRIEYNGKFYIGTLVVGAYGIQGYYLSDNSTDSPIPSGAKVYGEIMWYV